MQEECAILRANFPFVNLHPYNSGLLNFSVTQAKAAKFGLHAGNMQHSTHIVSVNKHSLNISIISRVFVLHITCNNRQTDKMAERH